MRRQHPLLLYTTFFFTHVRTSSQFTQCLPPDQFQPTHKEPIYNESGSNPVGCLMNNCSWSAAPPLRGRRVRGSGNLRHAVPVNASAPPCVPCRTRYPLLTDMLSRARPAEVASFSELDSLVRDMRDGTRNEVLIYTIGASLTVGSGLGKAHPVFDVDEQGSWPTNGCPSGSVVKIEDRKVNVHVSSSRNYTEVRSAWPLRLAVNLQAAFPRTKIRVCNAAQGGSSTRINLSVLDSILPGSDTRIDLVIVLPGDGDHSRNMKGDTEQTATKQMVRALRNRKQPGRPPALLWVSVALSDCSKKRSRCAADKDSKVHLWHACEFEEKTLRALNVPVVSYRNVTWPVFDANHTTPPVSFGTALCKLFTRACVVMHSNLPKKCLLRLLEQGTDLCTPTGLCTSSSRMS